MAKAKAKAKTKAAPPSTRRLRRAEHISFFRKKDEIYAYHDLWGFILQMDRKVQEFVEAFGRGAGRPVADVAREFRHKLRPEEIEGFVATFRQHRCLVSPRAGERADAFRLGYPSKAPWLVVWSPRPDEVVLSYKDRGLGRIAIERLDRLGSRFFNLADGERTAEDVAARLEPDFPGTDARAEVRRLLFRLTHSDRQVLKLTDRPLYEYLAFPPPYLRSTMPFPRLDAPDASAEGGSDPAHPDVVDLARYHGSGIEDAAAQFDVEETTLSHMFREPHDALGGKSYGEAFAEAVAGRRLWPPAVRPGPVEVIEIGGGVGFFALRLLKSLTEHDPALYRRLRYTILDLSRVLQDSQRMMTQELRGKVRHVLTNASRALPLASGSVDLAISNEVIADLETVRLSRTDFEGPAATDAPGDPPAVRDARALVRRHALPLEDAPEVFWLNLGALKLVEELARVLRPGGAAVLVEFGGESRWPVESTHLAHSEFSIHFGHLRHVARRLGLEVERTDVMDFLGMRGDVRVLATTRSYFQSLRALHARRGVTLQKIAYTEANFRALCGDRLDPGGLHGLAFRPTRERALGLHPPDFMVATIRKPSGAPPRSP